MSIDQTNPKIELQVVWTSLNNFTQALFLMKHLTKVPKLRSEVKNGNKKKSGVSCVTKNANISTSIGPMDPKIGLQVVQTQLNNFTQALFLMKHLTKVPKLRSEVRNGNKKNSGVSCVMKNANISTCISPINPKIELQVVWTPLNNFTYALFGYFI